MRATLPVVERKEAVTTTCNLHVTCDGTRLNQLQRDATAMVICQWPTVCLQNVKRLTLGM